MVGFFLIVVMWEWSLVLLFFLSFFEKRVVRYVCVGCILYKCLVNGVIGD